VPSWATWLGTGWRAGLTGFVLLVGALDLVSRSGLVHQYYFPPASEVLRTSLELLVDPSFLGHVANTAYVSLVGLGLICLLAIPTGMLLGSSDLAYRASSGLIEFVRPIPAVALIPVAVLALGTGNSMKIAMVVAGAVWPVLFNTVYGMHNVDPVARDTARSFGCSELQILRRVSLQPNERAVSLATGSTLCMP